MKSKWGSVKLGNYCSKIGSGSTPRGGSSVYLDNGEYALFRSQNILNNAFSSNGLVFIDSKAAEKLKNVSVEENDVLLNITGDSVARVCKAPSEYLPARVNQHVAIIRTNQDELNSSYVNYYLNSKSMQNQMLSLASAGATRNALTKVMIENFDIPKPPLTIQKKIAHILSTLDDKIELNRKMNKTLEEMAQALFKSWFVDFDPVHAKAGCNTDDELEAAAKELGISKEVLELFPSAFVESEMGMIPLGWEVKPFSQIASLSTKSIKPHSDPDRLWTHYSIPAFDESRYPAKELGEEIKSNKYAVDKSAILSSKLNPATERTWLPNVVDESTSICSTEFMQFVPVDPEQRAYVYYLIKSDPFQHEIKSRVTGTTGSRQRAQPKQVAVVDIVSPSNDIIKAFCSIASFATSKLLANLEEIQTLQKTRDTLLPKLLSGELDVSKINIEPKEIN